MSKAFDSGFKLGIIAGGQLGKLLAQAAAEWNLHTLVLDTEKDAPASGVCTEFIQGSYSDYDAVLAFGRKADVVTFEIEHINIDALKQLEREGKTVRPSAAVLELVQDKGLQKLFYQQHSLPTASFRLYDSSDAILAAVAGGDITFPFVQKLRKGGYDGRGVVIISSQNELDKLLPGASVIENAITIAQEISVIVARTAAGEMVCYPPVLMEFNAEANLVEYTLSPAPLEENVKMKAEAIARKIADRLQIVGLLAVELFLDAEGEVLINEIAPRPHNSGHQTIEGNVTSQYEQLLRTILDLPLGDSSVISPAVMLNLLGENGYSGEAVYTGLEEALKNPGVHIHLYGKRITRPMRKMGHITVTASGPEAAKSIAVSIKQTVKVISK